MFQNLKFIYDFLPKKVRYLILGCVVVGGITFLVESAFVYVLQIFLVTLGLVQRSETFLPHFIEITNTMAFSVFIFFGFVVGVCYMLIQYFTIFTQHYFIRLQRGELYKIGVYRGLSVDNQNLVTAFTELSMQAGNMVANLGKLIVSFTKAILLSLYAFTLAPKELLIGFTLLFVIFYPLKNIASKIRDNGRSMVNEINKINKGFLLSLNNNFLIQLYNLQKTELEAGKKRLMTYQKSTMDYVKSSAFIASFPILIGSFVISMMAYFGKEVFHTDSVVLVAVFYLFIRIASSIGESIRVSALVKFNFASLEKLEYWKKFSKNAEISNYSEHNISRNEKLTIKLSELSFGFDENRSLFENLNFEFKEGDKVLIKGRSGSGKSTLASIILGLLKPKSGSVEYCGNIGVPKNISQVVGYVGPDPFFITGSLKDNLLYSNEDLSISDQDILDALSLVQLEDVVDELNNGIHEQLTERNQLSTGQKQRMAFARALLRKPKLLILDEATSNLDKKTEEKIIQNLVSFSHEMIVLIITHHNAYDEIANIKIEL